MNFVALLAGAKSRPGDTDLLHDLARAALTEEEEDAALGLVEPAAKRLDDARLWQWSGLLHRAMDRHAEALSAFDRAAILAPGDAGIAHGRARVALEAGLDAVDLFQLARQQSPNDSAVLLGLAAARNAVGDGMVAADELAALLAHAPGWIEGHAQLAQLLSTLGYRDLARDSIQAAISRFPRDPALWSGLLDLDVRQEDYSTLELDVARAAEAEIPASVLAYHRAIVAAQGSSERFPPALFADADAIADRLGIWRIRHLLRVGEPEAALPIVDRELASNRSAGAWPYAAIVWRLTGDGRSAWLADDPRLVRTLDLSTALPPLDELAAVLRSLHRAQGAYLDQSVRGGIQTDGPLLSRIDPTIRQLRRAIVDGVHDYVSGLPPQDERHPTLSRIPRRPIRFSGSWSVLLRAGGRHSNHVHPQGWISSALYIDLPPEGHGERADSGFLVLGTPDEGLAVNLPAERTIQPLRGNLVLFPSWMWHGTVPFAAGERLTVAFDVRPPLQ